MSNNNNNNKNNNNNSNNNNQNKSKNYNNNTNISFINESDFNQTLNAGFSRINNNNNFICKSHHIYQKVHKYTFVYVDVSGLKCQYKKTFQQALLNGS